MSQSGLKLLALFAMLLDHAAKTVFRTGILSQWFGMETGRMLRVAMIAAGRMAFPIFAWFAAEGCRKTSDPVKRLFRLLLFAVISEIPFQLNFYKTLSAGIHNVNFTILLACAAIYLGAFLREKGVPDPWAGLLPGFAAVTAGWFAHTNYNAWGVALILVLNYLPDHRERLIFLGAWITVFQLIWHGWNGQTLSWLTSDGRLQLLYWLGAMAALALLATYNGERGRGSKWLYYVFYPSHLLLLYGLTRWLT